MNQVEAYILRKKHIPLKINANTFIQSLLTFVSFKVQKANSNLLQFAI